MGEKDEIFGLSLSLSLSLGGYEMVNPLPHLKVHRMQKPPQSGPMKHTSSWNDLSKLPDRSSNIRSFLRGVDVNSSPTVAVAVAAADCDNDNDNSSPNSTVSSISGGKQSDGDNNEAAVRASCSRGSDDEDGGERKKLRLTKEQAKMLEETFKEYNTLTPKRKQALAQELNLRPRQVEVWFQNRRARTKLKQTEVDCEYLKRCCENLTEENRRLQKEVQELRTLKLSPHFSMHMNPPTTLTMCPSCERVAVSSASSSTTSQLAVRPSNQNHNLLDLSIRQPGHVKPKPFEGSIFRP